MLRDGTRESALRLREKDAATEVLTGAGLVPGLAEALSATFADVDAPEHRARAGAAARPGACRSVRPWPASLVQLGRPAVSPLRMSSSGAHGVVDGVDLDQR